MSLDAQLLAELQPTGKPILHHYDWQGPSATYGHFIDPAKHLYLDASERLGLSFARRPTGGGIVFHIWDLAFSFLMPSGHRLFSENTLENYRFVNRVVLDAASEVFQLEEEALLIPDCAPAKGPACSHFCMARPTIYDVVYRERKIAGAAQRRTKKGYLHQGTISLALPDYALLKEVLRSSDEIAEAMAYYTFTPRIAEPLSEMRRALQEKLTEKFLEKIGADPV